MEGKNRPPPPYAFSNGQPSSPPATPGTRSNARFPPSTSQTSPIYKRMGLASLAQSPPLEFIEPIGQGPQFHFTRPQSRDFSSRPSSASGRACATSPYESDNESASADNESNTELENERSFRKVEEADFVLEEWDSDQVHDSDTEVVRPDHFEDAPSEKGERLEEAGIISGFSRLQCEGDSHDEEEQQRLYRKKKKRWSAGIFKRSHSQSVGSDSDVDDSDALDAHDVGVTARRLRRRVRGPGDRSSLIFDEIPNVNHIVEVEEPDDGGSTKGARGPPSIPSDDGFTLDELPFWVLADPMQLDLDSS